MTVPPEPGPVSPTPRRSRSQEVLLLLGIMAIFAGLDQWSKGWVVDKLGGMRRDSFGRLRPQPGMRPMEVIPGAFRITITGNEGAIWGLGKKYSKKYKRPFFIALSFVAMGFVLWLFYDTTREQWPRRVGLGLVLSGAVGNLIDRIRLDYVIDFLDWYLGFNWPTFNVADVAISVGVGLVIVDLFWHPNPVEEPPDPAASAQPPPDPPVA